MYCIRTGNQLTRNMSRSSESKHIRAACESSIRPSLTAGWFLFLHFVPQGAAVCGVLDLSRIIRNGTVRNPFSAASRYVRVTRNHREEKSSETKHRVQTKRRKAADNNNDNDERRERSQFSNGPEKVVAIHLLTYITLVSSLPPAPSPRGPLPTGLTPTRAHRQPTNCPVTHEPVVHVIAVTHKMTSGASPPRSSADPPPPLSLTVLLCFILKLCHAASTERFPRRGLEDEQRRAW